MFTKIPKKGDMKKAGSQDRLSNKEKNCLSLKQDLQG
jgi:hypothetical protein